MEQQIQSPTGPSPTTHYPEPIYIDKCPIRERQPGKYNKQEQRKEPVHNAAMFAVVPN